MVLDGFKSFYTRTEIDFSDDITCIVGPNGCGKSNILDAVRWVLGEQSAKQLRGQEISDLISAGNARRAEKSQAEAYLTFADVQDHLDTDKDEIEVGRVVDRDGTGTYLLNGDEVRLKDVQDMFRDTGVGQDLYSIIGQGEVVQLIESKPEERREIIEEAAGIATFRHRRDLTRRRLEQTREELEQVDKDLREKRGRLSQLKGQAEKAERVRDLQKELRECRFEKRRREFLELNDTIDELKEKKSNARETMKQSEKEKNQYEERLNQFEGYLKQIQQRINGVESQLQPLEDRHQDVREELSRLRTRRESLSDQINREEKSLRQHRVDYGRTIESLQERHREQYEAQVQSRVKQAYVDLLEQKERRLKRWAQSKRDELEGIRSRSLFEISEESEIKHRLNAAEEDLEETAEARQELDDRLSRQRQRMSEARADARSHFNQLLDAEVEKTRLKLKLQYRSREREVLSELDGELGDVEIRVTQKIESLTNREETLEQFIDNYEGFYPGVRAIMERVSEESGAQPAWADGVEGVLANMISVEPPHEQAVESVLERRVQSVVIDERESARDMIQFLKEQEAGTARFLSADGFSGLNGSGPPGAIDEHEGVVVASGIVDCEETVESIVHHLLSEVLIVEDMETAERVRQQLLGGEAQWTIVTREGERVDTAGTIFGGSTDSDASELLNRDEELDRLRDDLHHLELRRDQVTLSQRRVTTMTSELDDRVSRINNALQGIDAEIQSGRSQLDDARSRFRSAKNKFDNGSLRLTELIETALETAVEREGLSTVMDTVEDRESDRRKKTDELRRRLQNAEDRLETIQVSIRSRVRDLEESSSRRRELNNRVEELEDRLRSNRQDIRTTYEEIHESRDKWARVDARRTKKQGMLSRLKQRVEAVRTLKTHWDNRRQTHQEKLRSLNRDLQKAERETEKAKGQFERLDNELENEKARLEEVMEALREEHDYDGEPADLVEEAVSDLRQVEWEELTSRVRETQNEIRDLQPVNMLAQKELEGLEEEVTSVAEQKDDLEEACSKLERMIRRLNDRARNQFKEAFEEIQGYFEDFAAELFNGGEGYLELTDDPILDAGVTLEIQPPGEQLKSMAALSGGEKTLTALAFLFALFERKATPFAFLDEVDAPFDDENVAQFIQLLKRYGDRTQFVIITHNKATMQSASQLYGVTMEESGVSSLVSVELEEAASLGEQPRRATS